MDEDQSINQRLLQEALISYKEEYEEYSDLWHKLDSKAQATISISGIFLAAIFAFIRILSESAACTEKYFLSGSIILLSFTVLCGLGVLWIKSVPCAPYGTAIKEFFDDLLESDQEITPDDIDAFTKDKIDLWENTNNDTYKVITTKGRILLLAHVFLVLAILLVSILTIIKIWY